MRNRFLILATWSCLVSSAHAEPSATLYTDPVVQITAIDGDAKRKVLLFDARSDHGITLSPGVHSLDVCFERSAANSTGFDVRESWKCIDQRKVSLEARGGRLYRLKIALQSDDWKTWIEDVTDDESPLLMKPTESKHKGGGKSLVLVKVEPGDLGVSVGGGRIEHIWFLPGMFGTFMMSGDPADGYLSRKVSAGATLAITDIDTPKSSLIPTKTEFLCGDTRVPVLENLPGGGAYYLGEFKFSRTAQGPIVEVKNEGLEAARTYLKRTDPLLADQLQPAPLQWKRLPLSCPLSSQAVLRLVRD